jgi:hypothetical protein
MAAPILQFKRGNAGVAGTVPALRPGEPAISLNNFDFFIGIDTSTQNNKFFGSHRYWGREDGTNSLSLKLVDKDGSNSITLKAPNTLAGITTYTFPATPVAGRYLQVDANGNLSWADASGSGGVFTDATLSGITTITGALLANGNTTLGDASGDIITVKGTATFEQPITGTISTATRATAVDTNTATTNTYYPGLFLNNTGTNSASVFVDAGISYVSNTDTLTLAGDLAINGGDLTSTSTTFNLVNTNSTTVNAFGAAPNVVIGATTGITTIRNAETHFTGDIRVNGNDIKASDGNNNITLTSNTLTTFAGDIRVNGNDIQASDGNVNITMTSNTLTEVKGDLRVSGNDILSSSATALTLSGADVTVAGDITVGGNDIKASNGTIALTLATTGAVTAANDLTIQGNLFVNGNTTQVNATALTVEDRTLDLGKVSGAVPASATTWDLGVLFNYNSGGAKKSAVIWEHADARFKFASVLAADTNGIDNDTPQLTVTTFAPIEVAELWVNNSCSGGAQQVIGCIGSNLQLQNVVVDAGTF